MPRQLPASRLPEPHGRAFVHCYSSRSGNNTCATLGMRSVFMIKITGELGVLHVEILFSAVHAVVRTLTALAIYCDVFDPPLLRSILWQAYERFNRSAYL